MCCVKRLGVQYAVMGRMWRWNNKVLDLETLLGSHENIMPAHKMKLIFVSTAYQERYLKEKRKNEIGREHIFRDEIMYRDIVIDIYLVGFRGTSLWDENVHLMDSSVSLSVYKKQLKGALCNFKAIYLHVHCVNIRAKQACILIFSFAKITTKKKNSYLVHL